MNVCCICQADGVAEVLGAWHCVDHLEEAMLELTEYIARARGWDVFDSVAAIEEWMAS